MNCLLFIYVISVIAIAYGDISDEENKIFIELLEDCKKKTSASDDDIKALGTDRKQPETRTQFCLLACVYKKTDLMDNENKLNLDKELEGLEPVKKDNKELYDKLTKITKDCFSKYKPLKDECDSLKSHIECVVTSAKEAGL